MHAGGVVSGRRLRLVGSGVGMLAPHRRGVRLGSVHEGGARARASGDARATAWAASAGSNECVGGCVSPRAVGCAVGFRAQPFASEWGKAEADDDHDHPRKMTWTDVRSDKYTRILPNRR